MTADVPKGAEFGVAQEALAEAGSGPPPTLRAHSIGSRRLHACRLMHRKAPSKKPLINRRSDELSKARRLVNPDSAGVEFRRDGNMLKLVAGF